MHGLIFRTVEAFVTDSFGLDSWTKALIAADVPLSSFEAMLQYDSVYFPAVLDACARTLDRSEANILEDIGTYLITRQNHVSVRRLMRFGGQDFPELLYSLEDLPGRTRLAVPGLDLPRIVVREVEPHCFDLCCEGELPGFGHLLVGLLRAMADDYGVLAVLEHRGSNDGIEAIAARIVDIGFAEDRGFSFARAMRA
ncbi:heme NO-binding domain-containing protein [Marivita sp. GX14005]|uniref:heme NO-binding domain-containing protein n=1 Tax=Marivita sp. GX14005 TaxID=2942276 RepID=UPI002018BD09|nr:heme NO-binding domain-containing protein [Marivita sp. GX14005]MCL3882165.1 heme NO-binding domain-containing protein [Marivita sp. GX14005]